MDQPKHKKEIISQDKLVAGNFSDWLKQLRDAVASGTATDVPCGSCTACCRSYYFIHIAAHEKETLQSIPKELLFDAPGLPKGHKVLGFDTEGKCPMLKNDTCTIYETRPVTCRTYDCRIFPVTGIKAGDEKKVLINRQTQRWQFSFPNDFDKKQYQAIQNAVNYLVAQKEYFPKDFISQNTTQFALLVLKVSDLFIGKDLEVLLKLSKTERSNFIQQVFDKVKEYEKNLEINNSVE